MKNGTTTSCPDYWTKSKTSTDVLSNVRQDRARLELGILPRFRTLSPTYGISLDDHKLVVSDCCLESERRYLHQIDVPVAHGDHELAVRFDIPPNCFGNIEIVSIKINGKYLAEDERYHLAKYHLDFPQTIDGDLTDCYESICLGWPGTYRFKFQSPILFWSLLNIKSLDRRPQL